jgi:hypothetical protein
VLSYEPLALHMSEECDPVRDRSKGSGFGLDSVTAPGTKIRGSVNNYYYQCGSLSSGVRVSEFGYAGL